jgi:hypothetical protein
MLAGRLILGSTLSPSLAFLSMLFCGIFEKIPITLRRPFDAGEGDETLQIGH